LPVISVHGEQIYLLKIDEHSFELNYELDGDVLAMAIDPEQLSLLVGIENVKDSVFQIEMPNELIQAQNDEFAVLVNGYEIDYGIIKTDSITTLSFFVPGGSQEIEIIGTHVIPEFPISVILIIGIIMIMMVTLSRSFSIFH